MKSLTLYLGLVTLFVVSLYAEVKDHPQVGSIANSEIYHQEQNDFMNYKVITEEVLKDKSVSTENIEGKITFTAYKAEGNSAYGIYSTYKKLFTESGYEILFSCEKSKCGKGFNSVLYESNPFARNDGWNNSAPLTQGYSDFEYYISAKLSKADGEIYATMFVSQGWWQYPVYRLDVIETKASLPLVVTAEILDKDISEKGKIAIYGILFETGKSSIKPVSAQTMQIISKYINAHKKSSFYIVGHTDNVGGFESNMKLSKARADSVVKSLVKEYGVDKKQLKAHGVSSLAPLFSNSSGDGRARNRRVEIVQQ